MLDIWKQVISNQAAYISTFLQEIKEISKEYINSKTEVSEIGFNAFTIASDLYYRENFHSDIIKALLDPNEKHGEKDKYLNLFIELLNKVNPKQLIDKENYTKAKVIREQSRIDILIFDNLSKRAIIIENKINNANDMPRQLPRYYYEINKDYIVDAIVYITLDSSKRPDIYDWTNEELIEINTKLKIIPSYHKNNIFNLYKDWLIPAMVKTNNLDSYYLLRQYSELIKYLNTKYMDTISLEKFYETIKERDNLKTSISIRNMLNDLPEYLAIRIEDKYKNNCYPFKKVWRHKQTDTVFEAFEIEKLYLKLDIWCGENGYKVYFWNPQNDTYDIKIEFSNSDTLLGFEYDEDCKNKVVKSFNLFEENMLFNFIDNLLDNLTNKKNNNS